MKVQFLNMLTIQYPRLAATMLIPQALSGVAKGRFGLGQEESDFVIKEYSTVCIYRHTAAEVAEKLSCKRKWSVVGGGKMLLAGTSFRYSSADKHTVQNNDRK